MEITLPPPPPETGQLAGLSPPTHRCTQTPCGWCRWGCPWPRHWTQLLKPHCRLRWSCAVGRESPACLPALAWPGAGSHPSLVFGAANSWFGAQAALPFHNPPDCSLPLPTGTCCAQGLSETWSSLGSASSPRAPPACWPSPGSRPSRSGTPAGPRRRLSVHGQGTCS